MKWKPFRSGVPYTCSECPERQALQDEVKWLTAALAASRGWKRDDGQDVGQDVDAS